MKGSYILLVELPEEQTLNIGRLGDIHFPAGYYAYVGAALGGFKSRLNRHLRKDKLPKWHIDYLLQKAAIQSIIICETDERVECAIAQTLRPQFHSVPGFGSSDCRCPSHLFFAAEEMEPELMAVLNSLGLKPRLLENPSQYQC